MKRFLSWVQRIASRNTFVWITFFRGVVAISLGLALIVNPNKTMPFLVNFMGFFWLTSGALSIRLGVSKVQGRWIPITAGSIAVITGLAVIIHQFVLNFFSEAPVITALGIVIFLTGVLHAFGGFLKIGEYERKWSWDSFILGVFEIILGGVLVTAPLNRSDLTYIAASVWAVIGGIVIIGDAQRLRKSSVVS